MFTKWNQKVVLLIAALLVMSSAAFAIQISQENVWHQIERTSLQQPGIDNSRLPAAYETFRLNKAALQALLAAAPEEYAGGTAVILSLPMPDGSYQRFSIEHSLVVERGLLVKYPELGATYRGYGIDDPTAFVRFDFLPNGFHSMLFTQNGTVMVDPYANGDTDNYISYYKNDKPREGGLNCEVKGDDTFEPITSPKGFSLADFLPEFEAPPQTAPEVTSGTQLRTYRLALAANNEYCVAVGGNTVSGCLAAEVLIMNRVNGVYEKDLAMRMVIVANNNLVVYAGDNMTCPVPGGSMACTAANDPYGNDTSALGQNTPNLNTVIGAANYDIGHVFTTGSGGVAQLGVPCGGSKGAGTTGLPSPLGDPFAIDYVAHELGHQWGANHTFNGSVGNCAGGNRSASSAYEPGSGITIMAYAGICGNQNLAGNSIDTFHVKSLEVIVAFSQTGGGNACAVTTASGNTPPAVTGPGSFNIPKLTPFSLTATATDINPGDAITYDWQEYDLGAAATTVPNSDTDGQARPIFRPFLPTVSGTRTFPRLTNILNNANVPPNTTGGFLTGEILPSITRTMTFQVIARDNHPGTGGINTATAFVVVDGNSGPFAITSPNTAVSYAGNTFQTVTWNVTNTTAAPVNAANVKISLSTDGGNTFPTVISASTANDGTEDVLIPNTPSTTARIKVEAVGNIFFDISNTNFTITMGGTGTPTPTATNTGSATPTATATAGPTCAPFAQNWDSVTAPALPTGWTATNIVPGPSPAPILWTTSTTTPDSAPNAAFIDDADTISDKYLDSPPIPITATNAQLSFRNNFNTEFDPTTFWDGGVLEISSPNINAGVFTDVTDPAVGGSFVSGGYTGQIYNLQPPAGNPLAGRFAWSGNSNGYINTVVNLGSNIAGQTIRLRFRFGTDEAVSAPGWRIDNLSIANACAAGSATPTNTATSTPTPGCTPAAWQAGPLQFPARYAVQGALGTDNKLYIAGGQSIDQTPVLSNKFTRYNAVTNAWEDLANLPVALGQGTVGAANGKVYVAGGFTGGTTVVNSLRIYDIATNTWSSGANMPGVVEAGAGAVVNGKFYVMGGDDFNNLLNTNFVYDIATNTWATAAILPDSRTNTYGTVANGLIYVYGGVNALTPAFATTDTLLRFNPATNTWANLGSAGTAGARGNYGAISTYGTGQLLITDGANAAGASTTATHLFTISTGTFSAGPAMIEARAGHAQGTLPDGRVLVADGFNATFATTGVELLNGPCPTGTNTPTATPTGPPPTATSTNTFTPSNTPTATATGTPAGGELIYGMTVTSSTGTAGVNLVRFNSSTPGSVTNIGPFTGMTSGHAVRSIDFRPATGQLYAISTDPANPANAQLYTVNLTTAALTPVGTGLTLGTNTFFDVEMDFNPVADRIRIVTASNGTLGNNNFRAHPDTGALVAQDTNLAFDVSSPRSGATNFNIIGGAYANNVAGATQTTLYAWDYNDDALITIGGINGVPSPNGGLMFTISTPPGFLTTNPALGMDISGATGTMFVTHDDAATGTMMSLFTRSVATGAETLVGTYPAGTFVGDLSVFIAGGTPTPTSTPTFTPSATPTGSPSPTPQGTFANSTAICTTLGTVGAPYPSNIVVAGGPLQIDGIRVTLIDVFHVLPDNMDFLLVGPNGAKFILMADAGGSLPLNAPGVTLTFSDAAGAVLPNSAPLTTGIFEPTSWEPGQLSFPAPAPAAPYNEPGSTVGGTGTQTLLGNFPRFSNSNGTWSLYMRDDAGLIEAPTAITGCVNGGWQIQFVPTTAAGLGISGRVATAGGVGIRNATVVITGNSLAEPLVTTTGSFGYYSFDGLRAGETYVVTVNSRRYTFSTPSRVISLVDNVVDADFTANPQE